MKRLLLLLCCLGALLVGASFSHALTIPASEDSFSFASRLSTAGNKSGVLSVDATRKAYVYFDLSEVPTTAVVRWAKLRLFLPLVRVKGSGVNVYTVTGEWNEALQSGEPAISSTPVGTIGADKLANKRFVTVDVTSTVQDWINLKTPNEGLAFVSIPNATPTLVSAINFASKEGIMGGLPAELDIEFKPEAEAPAPVTVEQLPSPLKPLLSSGLFALNDLSQLPPALRSFLTPSITVQPSLASTGGSLTVQAQGLGSLSYQWMRNGVPVLGGTSAQLPSTGLVSGTYAVTVTNGFASVTTDSLNYGSQTPDWSQQGLIAYYPFDGDTLDRGPFKNHLVNTGATLSTDRFGSGNKCYQFNGTTNWMVSESNLPVSKSQPRTFLLWLKVPLDANPIRSGNPSIIEHGVKAGDGTLFSLLISSGPPKSLFVHGSWLDRGMEGLIPLGEWFHIAVSTDGNCENTRFYINGEAVAGFGENSGLYQTTETKLRLSTYSDSGGISNSDSNWWESGFKGWMDEIRVYNRKLNDQEVRSLYVSEKMAPSPEIVTVQGGTLPSGSALAGMEVGDFQIAATEVTWGEWKKVRTWAVENGYSDLANVGVGNSDEHPVTNVSWCDAVKWCNARSEMEGKIAVYQVNGATYKIGQNVPTIKTVADGYRLPTEAEWEWAARGGKQTRGYTYSGSNDLNAVGWYNGNSNESVHEVARKQPNELGIFDLSGNVWEWIDDWVPNHTGRYRLLRGGGAYGPWYSYAHDGEVTRRGGDSPDFRNEIGGFRVARTSQMVTVEGGMLPKESTLAGQVVANFQIGKTEVTWGEWKVVRTWAVANGYSDLANVGGGDGDDYPVTAVSWHDVAKWCNAKSEKEGRTPVYQVNGVTYKTGQSTPTLKTSANGYRLPTEAEWEWAARGGRKTNGYTYSGSDDIDVVGWYLGNSGFRMHEVGTKAANELGVFDMSGNAWEWCEGWFTGYVGSARVIRGGPWDSGANFCTVGSNYYFDEVSRFNLGFRVVLNSVP